MCIVHLYQRTRINKQSRSAGNDAESALAKRRQAVTPAARREYL
jgi:hypothetical protein